MPNLLSKLHQCRRLSSISLSSSSHLSRSINSQTPNSHKNSNTRQISQLGHFYHSSSSSPPMLFSNLMLFRFFSVNVSSNKDLENDGLDHKIGDSGGELGKMDLGFGGGGDELGVGGDEWYDPAVRMVVDLLDGYHDLTGLPWWITIASSTLALRVVLLPVLVVQLKKLKRIAELFPKLPPPFPPPFSGKKYSKQYLLFKKEKRAAGCPSFLWFGAYVSVQVPCFLLWMTAVRRMSLNHHPGFDFGGALWFLDLTELPHGVYGPIFPVLIASLHFINVQISFRTSSVDKMKGLIGVLAKYYKMYLNILTVPLFFIGYLIPQQLSLGHPTVRAKLGLPDKSNPVKTESSTDTGLAKIRNSGMPENVQSLSPEELLPLSIQFLAKGQQDKAIPLLQLALEKDPDFIRALVVLGQTLMQKGLLIDATEYLERAISKLFFDGHPTKAEELDLLILSSSWAGVTYIRQNKTAEGLQHLQRIAQLKEPDDPKSKAHYFDGLLLLASTLFNEGQKGEAAKHLRLAAAYDPKYNEYLQQCLEDTEFPTKDQKEQQTDATTH
ncbi:hypothetical protein Sjap_024744 [Stephania japonica]|uniref:ALBINO3-like protein 2, chloroplastic n=1 Tax=Stephania japonica TaxID=461633 RepID=A0AAP0EH63_9MAGN